MSLLKKIWLLLVKIFRPQRPPRRTAFSGFEIAESSESASKALKPGKLVLVGTAQKYKWLQFLCPCGCGDVQALNLMRAHNPFWTVEIHSDSTLTINPSVDAQKCGAHFWVRHNQITWC